MLANKTKLRLIRDATQAYPGTPVNSALWYYLRDRYQDNLSVATLIGKFLSESGYAYSFDGVDDRGVLAFRAINPDGDIDIEFRTGPTVPPIGVDYTVISQCLTATFSGASGKEFTLYFNSVGVLQALLGGTYAGSGGPRAVLTPNTLYRWRLQGSTQTFWVNGVQVNQFTVVRGTSREPSALTVVGAQTHGNINIFRGFYVGVISDLKINGVLWPIADRNQAIQLPSPSGLGAELLTQTVLENPATVGNQWSYLGNGRWQYIGDGSLSALTFINTSSQPMAGFLELEVESISGVMSCTVSPVAGSTFNTVGLFRYYYTNKDTPQANSQAIQLKRSGTSVASCVIKNISFKPLGTCNPLTLVNTASTGWQETDV